MHTKSLEPGLDTCLSATTKALLCRFVAHLHYSPFPSQIQEEPRHATWPSSFISSALNDLAKKHHGYPTYVQYLLPPNCHYHWHRCLTSIPSALAALPQHGPLLPLASLQAPRLSAVLFHPYLFLSIKIHSSAFLGSFLTTNDGGDKCFGRASYHSSVGLSYG